MRMEPWITTKYGTVFPRCDRSKVERPRTVAGEPVPTSTTAYFRRAFTLVEATVCIAIIGIAIALLIPAIQGAREAGRRVQCISSLRQLGLGMHSYLSTHNSFPPVMLLSGGPATRSGARPYGNCVSALARILPQLELNSLFNAINFDFLPDFSPGLQANSTAMQSSISLLLCPSDSEPSLPGYGRVNYRVSLGMRMMMSDGTSAGSDRTGEQLSGPFATGFVRATSDFSDGLSNTIGLSERLQGNWVQHQQSQRAGNYRLGNARSYLGLSADSAVVFCTSLATSPDAKFESRGGESWFLTGMHFTNYNHCLTPNRRERDCSFNAFVSSIHDRHMVDGVFSASSNHPGGVNALSMGGEVRFFEDSISLAVWRALSTRSSGEIESGDE
jgi:type II secretory pathway pseudopilin PulG